MVLYGFIYLYIYIFKWFCTLPAQNFCCMVQCFRTCHRSTSPWLHPVLPDFPVQYFLFSPVFFSLPSLFHEIYNILNQSSSFIYFLSTLGNCSTLASMTATLNFTHFWSTSSAFLRLSIYFERLHDTFFKASGWILIFKAKSSLIFLGLIRVILSFSLKSAATGRSSL